MNITREETSKIIKDYLSGKISKSKVFEWALNIIKSREFDTLDEKDRDLSDAIHALFCLHDNDERFDATREELEKSLIKLQNL